VVSQESPDLLPLTDSPPDPDQTRRTKRRGVRLLLVVLAVLGVLLLCAAGGIWALTNHYAGEVRRLPSAFPAIPDSERPAKPAGNGLTFLLVGVDSRAEAPSTGEEASEPLWKPGAQRSDSLMIVRLTADRRQAYVVSVPRDSWVPIAGHGSAKINAAFSYGGPALLVDTVEKLTKIRIDHVAIIDWDGFRSLTNALGGVTVTIPRDSYDSARRRQWRAGRYTLRGDDALDYVRQRHGLPNGDLDRAARQQNFLRAVMDKTLQQGTLSNPVRLTKLLGAVTHTVSVDDTLSNGDLRGLAPPQAGPGDVPHRAGRPLHPHPRAGRGAAPHHQVGRALAGDQDGRPGRLSEHVRRRLARHPRQLRVRAVTTSLGSGVSCRRGGSRGLCSSSRRGSRGGVGVGSRRSSCPCRGS
jgi:LCP family protein required for cell wall assembly